MSDFPDPDEEFELNYGDDLDLLNEAPEDEPDFCYKPPPKIASRRSLQFDNPKDSVSCSSPASQNIQSQKSSHVNNSLISNRTPAEPVAGPSWLNDDTLADIEDEEQLKKRKVEELFGDIDDIDLNEYSVAVKKKKTEDEVDKELIDKIVSGRQEAKLKAQSLRVLRDVDCSSDTSSKQENISKRIPKWPFVAITASNGERWYLRKHSDETLHFQISQIGKHVQTLGLLSASYSRLKEQAEEILKQKIEREHEAAFEKRLQALEESSTDSGCELMSEDEDAALWVEKYKPRHYLDLLSDESMNRTLLQWLKLWDKVVFGREKKVKPKPKEESDQSKKFHKGPKGSFKKPFKKFEPKNVLDEELDEHDCPKHKVALLCGPPGLGKTTLAHLVAKHAGYNVVEMNASDDRSPDAFRLQLESATQMQAVMGKQPRPNCLIIDEIDGAPAASIDVLLKFLSGKDISKKKGKKKEVKISRRPIVCICNDIYVPALRSLRQVAFTLQFPPTTASRLAQRLLEVARKQGLKTDMGTLVALAEKTQNDIRSCMSVLQFFKGRGTELRLTDVQRSNVGQKDMQKGLFSVWQEIFQIHRPRRGLIGVQSRQNDKLIPLPDLDSAEALQTNEVSRASRMQCVLQTVQSFGDYDRVAQGVFENYLNMNLKDTRLEGVTEGLEWFSYFDVMSTRIHTAQNYILMPYLPYAFATQRRLQTQQLLQTALRGMAPAVRAYTHAQPFLQDTAPLLLDLTVPALRPVSAQLFSARERGEMAHAVSVMLDYNLTYVQLRNADGAYENLEELALFPGSRPRRALAYGCKQLLAHELEMERVRRAEARLGPANAPAPAPAPAPGDAAPADASQPPLACPDPAAAPARPLPNHLQTLKARPVRPDSARVARDFFGRPLQQTQAAAAAVAAVKIDEIYSSFDGNIFGMPIVCVNIFISYFKLYLISFSANNLPDLYHSILMFYVRYCLSHKCCVYGSFFLSIILMIFSRKCVLFFRECGTV
ncbi:LOW QUALITY PROTEIN: Replication factor C subunit 1 [Gryllus bimaculatus]|nr:LOW QUALITY PROTEIN: Replication factor C subunit 1 [Gryllus bimaculatus]